MYVSTDICNVHPGFFSVHCQVSRKQKAMIPDMDRLTIRIITVADWIKPSDSKLGDQEFKSQVEVNAR